MMTRLILSLAVFSSWLGGQADAGNTLTRAECLADLNQGFAIVEAVHPNPYTVTSKERITSLRKTFEDSLPIEADRTEFFLGFAPIIASLRDGHTSLRPPLRDFGKRWGGEVFPIDVAFGNGTLTVANDWSGAGVPVGATLTKINGRRVEDIVNQLMPLQHAELLAARQLNIAKYFRMYLRVACDFEPPYEVSYRADGDSRERTRSVSSCSLDEINTRRAKGPSSPDYAYKYLPEHRLGVIDYNLCRPDDAFKEFLRSTFERIRKDKIASLVIDVRRNGGGSARANVALFDYIADKRYRMFAGGDIKFSALVKDKLGRKSFENRFGPWETPNGTVLSQRDGAPHFEPGPNELRFRGPIYVLSGVGTQSSGMNFVAAVKDYQLGIIVGEETGDPATAFGDLESFRLSNSGLEMYVSTKYFVRPNGRLDLHGIRPNFEVKQSRSDTRAGRDTALEFVKQHMASR